MNFKYVMIACAALMAGFTSCSNDDEEAKQIDGEDAIVRFSLVQNTQNTRANVDGGATDDEKKVHSAKLFVFNASQLLEKTIEFDPETTSKVETIKSGLHHFLVAVNYDVDMDANITLSEGRKILRDKMTGMADIITKGGAPGYFMTNVDDFSQNLSPTSTSTNPETVKISVGRAMAKVKMACENGDNDTSLSGPKGKLVDIKYMAANNPKAMYNFPVRESGIYKAAYFDNDVYDWMSDDDHNDLYFPSIKFADTYIDIHDHATAVKPVPVATKEPAIYIMENANKIPRNHNASYLLISGQFQPEEWVDVTNTQTTASSNGTFYRLYNVTHNQYYDYYIAATDAEIKNIDLKDFAKADVDARDRINVIKYENGYCYYAFYLRNDKAAASDSRYTVKRNVFYDVKLKQVLGAGASVPNIVGNGGDDTTEGGKDPDKYIPGTGGGDGDGNNHDNNNGGGPTPIDENATIQGEISVEDWDVVEQPGTIG